MQIVKIYKTSKGFFTNKEEADRKCNRVKEYDFRGCSCYEHVNEIFAIFSEGKYFELSEIKVQ